MYRSELLKKAQHLEDLAYATPQRNRVIGSPGHNATVNWIVDILKQYPDYYTYELQPFDLRLGVSANLTINGAVLESFAVDLSTEGTDVTGEIVVVPNFACDAVSRIMLRVEEKQLLTHSRQTFQLKSKERLPSCSVDPANLESRLRKPPQRALLVSLFTTTPQEPVGQFFRIFWMSSDKNLRERSHWSLL